MQPCLLQTHFTCDYSAFNNGVLGKRTLQTHRNRCTMLCKFLINRFTHLVSEVWRRNCSRGLSWLPRAESDGFKLSSLLNQKSQNKRCSVYNKTQQLGALLCLSVDSSIIWLILHIRHVRNSTAGFWFIFKNESLHRVSSARTISLWIPCTHVSSVINLPKMSFTDTIIFSLRLRPNISIHFLSVKHEHLFV